MNCFLPITYVCNWHCNYCIVDTHNQSSSKATKKKVLKCIENIPEGCSVHIEGGEPGTVNEEDILEYFKLLKEKNCEIVLNTNGLFLEKYPKIVEEYVDDILYHCIEHIEELKEIQLFDISVPITYMLLVNDSNFLALDWYYDNYNIQFFVSSMKEVNGNSLSNKNALYIIKNYKVHGDSISHLLKGN
jgi:organic radical activating enzyme